jgi:hypothetical protein
MPASTTINLEAGMRIRTIRRCEWRSRGPAEGKGVMSEECSQEPGMWFAESRYRMARLKLLGAAQSSRRDLMSILSFRLVRPSVLQLSRLSAAIAAILFFTFVFALRASAQGRVMGHIDGVNFDGTKGAIWGWACQQGQPESITVRVLANNTFLVAGKADQGNEAAVGKACRDEDGKHRFRIQLPAAVFAGGRESSFAVLGLPVSGGEASPIAGSGTTHFPPAGGTQPSISQPASAEPATGPRVSGSYISSAAHPRVFFTAAELEGLAKRINTPGTYSARRFSQLSAQVERDVASGRDWNAAYAGCNSDTYNYAFSYEPQTIEHDNHAEKVRVDLGLGSSVKPPGGAAVVAARVALYAALLKAGAVPVAGGPTPDHAVALAKQVLLAWSSHGFRDNQGRFLNKPSQFCDGDGKFNDAASVGSGLMVARGILYSVQTEDMLTYLGDLNDAEAKQVKAFHSAILELLLNALNYNFAEHHAWECDHYSNHAANQLAALLALARDVDKQKEFEAVLNGNESSVRVTLPWVAFFQRAIYGDGDTPNACYANKGADGSTSKPFFQTSVVAAGEIDDRYRNADPGKGIGYPMFTLERLYNSAEILRIAGFDAYGYRGSHRQSIEMATAYYACFAKGAGFFNVITPENSGSCPDAAQYYGKIVSGVDRMVVIGGLRFPSDNAITGVEAAAKTAASTGPFSLDALLFGKWRD